MLARNAVVLLLLTGSIQYGANNPKGAHYPPSIAAADPNPDYPLKVRILTGERKQDRFSTRGSGSGDLLGDAPLGFDYKYDCPLGFLHNEKPRQMDGDFYQGKWLKPEKKLEILTQQPGSTRVDKCSLDITLVTRPYDRDNPPPDPKEK